MTSKNLTVVVTRRLPKPVEARLSELFNAELNQTDEPFSQDQLADAMERADVLVPTLNDHIDAELIDKAGPQLKLIANYGSGFDHIDIKAAHKKGIQVSNSPSSSSSDTADMAIALILAVMRRFTEGSDVMTSGDWEGWSPSAFLGTRVTGKKLGILGMGRIGTELARRARAFSMDIHYHNRKRVHSGIEDELEATYWKSLKVMLTEIDILSINCPFNASTHHIINKEMMSLMKPSAVIINTARGELIEEDALIELVEAGKLAGAGLDVLERSHDINPKFRELKNIMVLPHMGSATTEARTEMGEKVIFNIKMMEDGHRPPNLIVPSML